MGVGCCYWVVRGGWRGGVQRRREWKILGVQEMKIHVKFNHVKKKKKFVAEIETVKTIGSFRA